MKRIGNVEELIKFEDQRQKLAVEEGYLNADDAKEWMVSFEEEAKRFWEQESIESMMVLDIDELEDEEYALATFIGCRDEYRMVYMSCRCNDASLLLF